jgi:hypothetical protein
MLRPTSSPVYHVLKPPYGAQDQSFITARQLRGALSDEKTGLLTIPAGTRQLSSSQVRAPLGLMTIFYCPIWDSLIWRARSPYLYPQRTGWPSYTPGTGLLFRRLLRLPGLRWRYSNPPLRGVLYLIRHGSYIKYRVQQFLSLACLHWSPTPRQIGRLTIGHKFNFNFTLTSVFVLRMYSLPRELV